jgi:phospholipid N-methyltransferase
VPAAATSEALNKRIKMFNSKAVPDDLFEHQQRQTDQALSSNPLLLLPTHGSSDSYAIRHVQLLAA